MVERSRPAPNLHLGVIEKFQHRACDLTFNLQHRIAESVEENRMILLSFPPSDR